MMIYKPIKLDQTRWFLLLIGVHHGCPQDFFRGWQIHKRRQDFFWELHFFPPKKVNDFFSRRSQNTAKMGY